MRRQCQAAPPSALTGKRRRVALKPDFFAPVASLFGRIRHFFLDLARIRNVGFSFECT
jgi:hypothetical protein